MIVNVEGAFTTASFPSLQVSISLASVAEDIHMCSNDIRFGVIVLRNLEGVMDERLNLPEFSQPTN